MDPEDAELDNEDDFAENEGSYPAASGDDDDDDDGGEPLGDTGQEDEILEGAEQPEPLGEPGGAASLAQDEDEGAVPESSMPSPPPGFSSWEQAYEAQTQRAQQLEYEQQTLRYQQAQEAQQRQQQQQAQGFAWRLPHEVTPDVRMAMQLRGTESYEGLSAIQRQQAEEVSTYMQGHWDRWTHNPQSFVADMVLPQVAPALQHLTEQLAELKAAEFRRQNQGDLEKPEDVHRYLELVQEASRDPYQTGLQLLRAQRALAEAQSAGLGNKTQARDKQAKARSAKGKPVGKGRTKGRRGKRKGQLTKAERGNPQRVAEDVMQRMLAAGDLTQADLSG